jgi:hypothetical protein
MDRGYFIKNLVLIVVIVVLGLKLYAVWTKPLKIPLSRTTIKTERYKDIPEVKKEKKLNEADYDIIYKNDLFRPSRSPVKKKQTHPQPFPREKPQLFGTIIKGDENLAIIEDPSLKETKVYSLGDTISGLAITDILKDTVILGKGEQSIQLKLRAIKTFKALTKIRKKARRRPRRRPSARTSPSALRDGR